MNKISTVIIALMLWAACYNAQSAGTCDPKPFIEVTGTSETEISPDEIYITITLLERSENKEKLTIEKQEKDLKQELKDLGIDLSNLVLSDAHADYQKLRKSNKDVVISKTYILKVISADLLGKVYEKLDKINAYDAYISKVSNSKLDQYKKENRIKAIKAAKDKVDYLLAAINLSGKALQITETDNNIYQPYQNNMYRLASKSMANTVSMDQEAITEPEMGFKKIKITNSFLVRYEIIR
ncbi:MAG: SIMPL domain-containing protein [Bacteroidota bacterium]